MAYLYGASNRGTPGQHGKMRAFNRAMSYEEMRNVILRGVDAADVGGRVVPFYVSDFSSGVDGATGVGGSMSVAGAITAVGRSNLLLAQIIGTSAPSFRLNNTSAATIAGKYALYELEIAADPDNVSANGFDIRDQNGNALNIIAGNLTRVGAFYSFALAAGWNKVWFVANASSAAGIRFNTHTSLGVRGGEVGDKIYVSSGGTKKQIGQTTELLPESIQLAPGQWLDTSGNRSHVYLPDGTSTQKVSQSGYIYGTNTWAASTTGQHIAGIDAVILPTDSGIRVRAKATDSGTFDLGDGVDQDRYAAGVTIDTDWKDITLLLPANDNTNRKLVWTPTASYTGAVETAVLVEKLK